MSTPDFGMRETESPLFIDDVAMIADMLKDEWSLGQDYTPIISYKTDSMMANGREAYIFVYQTSRYSSISSTDYATLQRTSFIGIRISCINRDQMYLYMDEVYRILMANRRSGPERLHDYTYLEVENDHIDNNPLGWYSATIDIKMMNYAHHILSPGFGKSENGRYNV